MSGKKRTIHPFSINMIFKKIEDQRILRSAEGRFSFTREEKVELVFPAMIGDYLRQLSSSPAGPLSATGFSYIRTESRFFFFF